MKCPQVFEYVLYEPMELYFVRRFRHATWMYQERRSKEGGIVRIPSQITIFFTRWVLLHTLLLSFWAIRKAGSSKGCWLLLL